MRSISTFGRAAALAVSLAVLPGAFAAAAEIRVLCGLAMKPAMVDMAPAFERATGHKVTVGYGTIADLAARIDKGELADVVILSAGQIKALEQQGRLVAGSATSVAKSGVGLLVRKGAARPDVSSVGAMQRALLAAGTVGHADPARGGSIATYVAAMLDRLEIASEIRPKIRLFAPSDFSKVASGDIDLAFGGVSEILSLPDVDYVGPLPGTLQNYTSFGAGVLASSNQAAAGAAFLQFLASPAGLEVLKMRGFDAP